MTKRWGAATALCLGLSVAPAAADPAIWTVRDADTTVNLFGTIHLLKPDTDWRSPALDDAMQHSDELWLEIDVLNDTSAVLATITKGTSPDRPLASRLADADYAAVVEAADAVKMPMSRIEKLRPWLAALTLQIEAIHKAGYDATGVDLHLAMEAQDRGLSVRAFETGGEQIGFFDQMPEATETAFLIETARMSGPDLDLFHRIFNAWEAGDVEAMDEIMVQSVMLADKELFDILLVDRNRAWAERFDEIMAEPGERTVAVGAGHLVGKDSLPELLRAKGWTVELVANED